jgi:hypothetical protein
MHGLDLSPHDEVLLRGPVPERALRVAASAWAEALEYGFGGRTRRNVRGVTGRQADLRRIR